MSGRARGDCVNVERLRVARERSGYTQSQLGEHAGVVRQTYADWERGRRSPTLAQANRLAHALRVPLLWLLGIDDQVGAGARWNVCGGHDER
jgi:transcriptional regulator with XRE-family HTH domain